MRFPERRVESARSIVTDLESLLKPLSAHEIKTLAQMLLHRPMFRIADLALRWGVTTRAIQKAKAEGRIPKPRDFCGPAWTLAQLATLEATGRAPKAQRKSNDPATGQQLSLEIPNGREAEKAKPAHTH